MIFSLLLCIGTIKAQNEEDHQMLIDTSYHAINEPFEIGDLDVFITPPAYFMPFVQNGNQGFIHKGAGSTIQVQIIEGVLYPFITASLSEEELLKQNAKLVEKFEVLTNQGEKAEMMIVSFSIKALDKDVAYERLMLFTGDTKRSIWISANYPVVAKPVVFQVLKESLLSVTF